MKAAVVVPTNRPERIKAFVQAWEPQFNRSDVKLMVIEDSPEPEVDLPDWVIRHSHRDIVPDCIPLCSGGIRDWGFYQAAKFTATDMIVSLDDDVTPDDGVELLPSHWAMLNQKVAAKWIAVIPSFPTRGFPYSIRQGLEVKVNHGLWTGMPDVDAKTQICNKEEFQSLFEDCLKQAKMTMGIPLGYYFPMCIMNVAFKPDVAVLMYMPKMPKGFERWDDIWCGLFMKRICDHNSWGVTTGQPYVYHERASNPLANLNREFLGYGPNEWLWRMVDEIEIVGDSLVEQYFTLAERLHRQLPREMQPMTKSMMEWCELWR